MGLFRELWEINHRSEVRRSDGPTTRFAGCPVEMDGGGYDFPPGPAGGDEAGMGVPEKERSAFLASSPSIERRSHENDQGAPKIDNPDRQRVLGRSGWRGSARGALRSSPSRFAFPGPKDQKLPEGIERLLRQIASLNEQNKRFIQETLDLFGRDFLPVDLFPVRKR